MKYRWTYLDPRGKWYLRARSYFSFGTSLHNVLQRFHDEGDRGVQTTAEALASYEENWISAGYNSAEEMAEAFGEGKIILERYVEESLARQDGARTLFVERQLRADLGEFVLIGRVDRVDEYPDGQLEIIDYKSGRQQVDAEELRTDLAMTAYQFLLRTKFPDKPVSATIIALRTGDRATVSLSEAEIAEFVEALKLLGNEILNQDFSERVPVRKSLCEHCDFLPLCKQHPEFATEANNE